MTINRRDLDYPPLTSTVDYPLHPQGVYEHGPQWWACDQPERPRDRETTYDWRCPGCVVAAQAAIVNQGDDTMLWTATGGAEPVCKMLSWMVARSVYWFKRAT